MEAVGAGILGPSCLFRPFRPWASEALHPRHRRSRGCRGFSRSAPLGRYLQVPSYQRRNCSTTYQILTYPLHDNRTKRALTRTGRVRSCTRPHRSFSHSCFIGVHPARPPSARRETGVPGRNNAPCQQAEATPGPVIASCTVALVLSRLSGLRSRVAELCRVPGGDFGGGGNLGPSLAMLSRAP